MVLQLKIICLDTNREFIITRSPWAAGRWAFWRQLQCSVPGLCSPHGRAEDTCWWSAFWADRKANSTFIAFARCTIQNATRAQITLGPSSHSVYFSKNFRKQKKMYLCVWCVCAHLCFWTQSAAEAVLHSLTDVWIYFRDWVFPPPRLCFWRLLVFCLFPVPR